MSATESLLWIVFMAVLVVSILTVGTLVASGLVGRGTNAGDGAERLQPVEAREDDFHRAA